MWPQHLDVFKKRETKSRLDEEKKVAFLAIFSSRLDVGRRDGVGVGAGVGAGVGVGSLVEKILVVRQLPNLAKIY